MFGIIEISKMVFKLLESMKVFGLIINSKLNL
jgi:hypothetical protein